MMEMMRRQFRVSFQSPPSVFTYAANPRYELFEKAGLGLLFFSVLDVFVASVSFESAILLLVRATQDC